MKRSIRWGVISFFFTQGLCFASWASRIPDIKNALGLSDAGLGSVLFALPAGSMAGLPFAGWLVTRMGSKAVVLFAGNLYVLTLVGIGFTTMTWHLASFHGAWSVAGFIGAGIGALLVSNKVHPSWHFIGIALLCFTMISIARHYTLRAKISGDDHPIFAIPDKPLLKLGLIGFCGMACEGAMFDWSGVYFQKVVMAPSSLVTLGYVVFMCAMAAGRFTGDRLANTIGKKRMIQLRGILIASGLMLSVLLPNIISVTLGFLLVGFGVSSIVPLVYSAAGKSQTFSLGMALAAVSTISFFGFLIGPPLIDLSPKQQV
ncbi:MAG: MFS transporter [Chryseolinea sp.]